MYKITEIGIDNVLSSELLKDRRLNSIGLKNVLGQAILYCGLEKNAPCTFFRTNKSFAKDAGVLNKDGSTTTFRFLIQKLKKYGLIEELSEGNRKDGATVYKLPKEIAALNPFFEDKKELLPPEYRLQITDTQNTDVDYSLKKNNQQMLENRKQITEEVLEATYEDVDSLDFLKNPTTTSGEMDEMWEHLKDCVCDNDSLLKEMEKFAKKGQDYWNFICEKLCEYDCNGFKSLSFGRVKLEKKYKLSQCLPYKDSNT